MKKRIINYLLSIETKLDYYEKSDNYTESDINKDIERHLIQISMFQHERLIHLIVTVLFALLTIISILYNITNMNLTIFILTILLLILLIPYIKHYYLLENSVQKMYAQYDRFLEFKDSEKNN